MRLALQEISASGEREYRVRFLASDGSTVTTTCRLVSGPSGDIVSPDPDIFMTHEMHSTRAVCAAIWAFHVARGHADRSAEEGEPDGAGGT